MRHLAEGKLEHILQRGKLIVGTGVGNPPWHFRDEKGEMAGFDVDVAKIVAKGLFGDDTKIEYVNQASDARIPNIVTDKVDITCQFMTVTAERAQQVNFTIPYYREGVGLMMAAGGKYKSRDEMKAAGAPLRFRFCKTSMPKKWCTMPCRKQRSTSMRVSI